MSQRPPIAGEKRWIGMLGLVVLALGQAVTMVVTAFATRDVIGALRTDESTIPVQALAAIAISGLAIFALRSGEGALGERTGQSYAAAIRRTLFLHMTKMPLSAMAERRAGATALRFVGDLTAFKGWVARGLTRLISACVTIPAAFLILFLLEPRLAMVAAGPIGLVMAAIYWLGNPLGEAHADLRSKRARLAAAMAERLPQGIALRRSGRIKTELRLLDNKSQGIMRAAVRRAWLGETVRAMPDAAAGTAGALCLWVCLRLDLGVADAVAALTALALIVWPLRHLADVRDRQKAYAVALAKLDAALASPRLRTLAKVTPVPHAPAIHLDGLRLQGLAPIDLRLERGVVRRVSGPASCGKSRLLLTLSGLEGAPSQGKLQILGTDPAALTSGTVLYLGSKAPMLKGSLRRALMLGTGRTAQDDELEAIIDLAGLSELAERLGGLDARVSEGARNLTASEHTRLYLARGLISRSQLALVDADEIGLCGDNLALLIDHFDQCETAALIVAAEPTAQQFKEPPLVLQKSVEQVTQVAMSAA
ncbi:ABC transporter ATP-binding protein [Cognatiyoonia sp. IB215446]|uniref:ABC transporter ATP-binding protein n=1 Tax=Cognatiyoonia sp. IB215446 TaxID=3097355 RepID=UPI002A10C500|nr:ABC transporter ATP-binding protein [Cognatiyoonia sp. IB215446]MDX8348108.1 ABC transporter ATP-binding protein [Cognatiyoonia sp. IB215446]